MRQGTGSNKRVRARQDWQGSHREVAYNRMEKGTVHWEGKVRARRTANER